MIVTLCAQRMGTGQGLSMVLVYVDSEYAGSRQRVHGPQEAGVDCLLEGPGGK